MKINLVHFKTIAILITMLSSVSFATDDIKQYQNKFSSSDVLALFGQRVNYKDPTFYKTSWMDVNAQLNTNIECGRIQFATNITDTINKLKKMPEKIVKTFSQSFPALIDAAPILALCATDPILCAELKNLNLKLDFDIGLQTNACHAINKYVNNQADKGKMEAYNKTLQKCVNDRSGGNTDSMLEAMNYCQEKTDHNNVLVADIINKKFNSTISEAQSIIKSVLTSSGQYATQNDQDRYSILNAALGEMQLLVNGAVVPVLDNTGTVVNPDNVSQFFLAKATSLACDTNNLYKVVDKLVPSTASDPKVRYLENISLKSANKSLTKEDVNNLDDISIGNRDVICSFLGRSLALKSMDYFIADTSSAMNSVQNNDFIPEEIRKKYSDKSAQFFESLKNQINPEEAFPINIVRLQIANMAKLERVNNRTIGSMLTKESIKNAVILQTADSCDSVYTCK